MEVFGPSILYPSSYAVYEVVANLDRMYTEEVVLDVSSDPGFHIQRVVLSEKSGKTLLNGLFFLF